MKYELTPLPTNLWTIKKVIAGRSFQIILLFFWLNPTLAALRVTEDPYYKFTSKYIFPQTLIPRLYRKFNFNFKCKFNYHCF